jgi:hypothetical protein
MTYVLEADRTVGRMNAVLTGEWDPEIADLVHDGRVDGVVLNVARGFRADAFSFLEGLPLKRLRLLSPFVDDVSELRAIASTVELLDVMVSPKARLDVAAFPRLTHLVMRYWAGVRDSISKRPELQYLGLANYPERDLGPVSDLDLRVLQLKGRPRLESLRGLGSLRHLRKLQIVGAAKLVDIAPLAQMGSSLTELDLESCRNLGTFDSIRHLPLLTKLNLGDCGNVASLQPLAELTSLELLYLYESTNVRDGDLSQLLGLRGMRDLRIMNRRHYSPSVDAVKRQLGIA